GFRSPRSSSGGSSRSFTPTSFTAGSTRAPPPDRSGEWRPRPAGCGSRNRGERMRIRRLLPLVFLLAAPLIAQTPTPTPPSPTPAPPDDVRMIRSKISAGDLPSAESILDYHRAEKGEDGDYLLGLAWVARGAALTGDWKSASEYAKTGRAVAEAKLRSPADYD